VRHSQEAVSLRTAFHIVALLAAQGLPQCVHIQRPLPYKGLADLGQKIGWLRLPVSWLAGNQVAERQQLDKLTPALVIMVS